MGQYEGVSAYTIRFLRQVEYIIAPSDSTEIPCLYKSILYGLRRKLYIDEDPPPPFKCHAVKFFSRIV